MSDFLPQLIQQLFNGLSLGAIYALIAIGYTMVYGIIGMINFAHGEVYMIGAYAGLVTLAAVGAQSGLPVAVLIALMLLVCGDVFLRYVLNRPSQWGFELSTMMYGVLFMMCGAYTLAQDGHVRGDFLYGSMKPRTQA